MSNFTINTLNLFFNLPLHAHQIQQWRGAFIEMGGWEDSLFHNHKTKDTYHYRYPLIQYRTARNRAALFAIGDGIPAFQSVLANNDWSLNWNGQSRTLQIVDVKSTQSEIKMLTTPETYRLRNWLALNRENYKRWQNTTSLRDRVALLERVLAGQLLGFCTAIDYRLPERLEVSLENINCIQKVRLHGNPMIAFDVNYNANIKLPEGIALGKGKSIGFGYQCSKNKQVSARSTVINKSLQTLSQV